MYIIYIYIYIYKRIDTFTMAARNVREKFGGTSASLLSHESFPDKATIIRADNEARDGEILFG